MIGADKIISYDPPGALGLSPQNAVVLLRFDEEDDETRPRDVAGALDDLDVIATGTGELTMPGVVDGVLGYARAFVPLAKTGLAARDRVSGASLLTRDISVQVVMSLAIIAQDAVDLPGNIVSRGLGGSSAEYVSYALDLEVMDLASAQVRIRWRWQDIAGTMHTQAAATFTMPPGFTMLTATRRWVSPTQVEIAYYVGDALIGAFTSSDGSIGGGTTGTFQVGSRMAGGVDAIFLAGTIDELLVVGYEMAPEEIAATWHRITVMQVLGEQLFIEMHDPGFPLPRDPSADAARENRQVGQAIGYAAAAVTTLRNGFLPQHAYGKTLEQWEELVRVVPRPEQDLATRRARVVARIRQRLGSSLQGFRDALADLLGGADPNVLQFLAFDNTVRDEFPADVDGVPNTLRWATTPASFAASGGPNGMRATRAVGDYTFDGATKKWSTALVAVQGAARGARVIAELRIQNPATNAEAGVVFGDRARGNYLLLGVRNVGGSQRVRIESFLGNVSVLASEIGVIGATPGSIWLHLWQIEDTGVWNAAWSTVASFRGPYTVVEGIAHAATANYAGVYVRSAGTTGGLLVVDFHNFAMRQPYGTRPFNAYVYFDQDGLGVSPDTPGARAVVEAIKHAFIDGTFTTRRAALCDDSRSGCDRTPMGAI